MEARDRPTAFGPKPARHPDMRSPVSLPTRIDALQRATELAAGRLPTPLVEAARTVLARSRSRLTHGTEWTVVALAGATGSGKSSLFNALAGSPLSASGVRRPTTASAHAAVWGEQPPDQILEWLDVPHVHRLGTEDPRLDGLLLLDLPDHDSVEMSNRMEMQRLVALVDLLIWVVDPEKYADAALHDRFLRPMTEHGGVMMFALNQVDRLLPSERSSCRRDLKRLLRDRGLAEVPVIETSAREGTGITELREAMTDRVQNRRAANLRIEADARTAAADLARAGGGSGSAKALGKKDRARLVRALSDAAGIPTVLEAVAAGHRRDARARVGWPVTRWLAGLRAHPLRRLGLGNGRTAAATSLPRPGGTQLSSLKHTLRDAVAVATRNLPDPWPAIVRRTVVGDPTRLVDPLDQAIAGAEVMAARTPMWWRGASWLQALLLLATVAGGVWLLVLFGFSYLRLPEPPTPEWRGFPVPTLMALGGAATGFILGLAGRGFARLGGKRAASRVRRLLEERVADVTESHVLAPLDAELAAFEEFRAALSVAGTPSEPS